MSMDNDTRLAMMHMRNDAQRQTSERPRRARRRPRTVSSAATTAMAFFALTLFTRGA